MAPSWPRVVAVVGPTASGKSALALELAERLGGQIVNADAYQLYRGMDIGTAKPSPADRARVPHHLIGVLEVTEEASVAEYQQRGRAVLRALAERDVPAVVVGGSGLYVRALLDDLHFPGSDPAVRARWEQRLEQEGAPALHAVLAARDPEAAAHILPSNGRRIVRALEVGEITGRPFPAVLPPDGPTCVPHVSVGLRWGRAALDERIAKRVHAMMAAGFEEEVRILAEQGLRGGRTASRALGYQQLLDVLGGRIMREAAIDDIIASTRSYARRQERWFRRDSRTWWVDAPASAISTALEVEGLLRGPAASLGP